MIRAALQSIRAMGVRGTLRWLGRKVRSVPHFTWNVLVLFFKKDLRKLLFRHNGHPVRLLLFRLLDTAWVLARVGCVALIGLPLAVVFVLAVAIGYGAAELMQVWCPLERNEGVDVSSTTWR